MALKVRWTLTSKRGLYKVIEYLEQDWTAKEILQLQIKFTKTIKVIVLNPRGFSKTKNRLNLHRTIVYKNNVLFYKYYASEGIIL